MSNSRHLGSGGSRLVLLFATVLSLSAWGGLAIGQSAIYDKCGSGAGGVLNNANCNTIDCKDDCVFNSKGYKTCQNAGATCKKNKDVDCSGKTYTDCKSPENTTCTKTLKNVGC